MGGHSTLSLRPPLPAYFIKHNDTVYLFDSCYRSGYGRLIGLQTEVVNYKTAVSKNRVMNVTVVIKL